MKSSSTGQCRPPHKIINNEADIAGIRAAAAINDAALDLMDEMAKPGIDTATLDNAVYEFLTARGAVPADLNFEGYPKSVCISINDVVCHGIPSKKTILKEGDIVNIDMTTKYNGYFADASRMYMIGEVSEEAARLVRVTRECMMKGIEAALGGHGVGKEFHCEPFVPHVGEPGTGMLLVPGMTLTVEPMINQGTSKVKTDKADGWTVRTKDGKLSAQWENTILITETGAEVISS